MKMTKILLLISMAIAALSIKMDRKTERKTKTKAKAKTNTEVRDELTTSSVYTVYIYSDGTDGSYSTCTFKAKDVWPSTTATSSRQNGWYFTCSDKQGSFTKIATASGSDYFIDYRNMGSLSTDTSSSAGRGKRISFTVLGSDSKTYSVTVQFVYSVWECGTICPTDLVSLASSITTLRGSRITKLKGYISTALTQALNADAAQTNVNNLSKSTTDYDALITAATANKTTLTTLQTTQQSTIDTYYANLTSLEAQVTEIKNKIAAAQTTLSATTTQINQTDTDIATYTAAKTDSATQLSTAKTTLSTALAAGKAAVVSLSSEITTCATALAAAQAAFEATTFVKDTVSTNINQINVNAA